eukprot:CAMPEP_0172454702 /NCGR_PEP_ID=MMETSP1065-20121228/11615_1 /TAXON_ID=265537 /ORGANISM="Amphiprora paludosa, Strain CCMP125" /LENGTH=533 /DNA_ID=CAMNT_0013207081 /DNA_START=31 /DNA_END=1632 /DNA_ORIENTATION=-
MPPSTTSDQVNVLYVDHQGHPAPLSSCYHATGTRRLSSSVERFPPSTLTEIDSAYCPQCLSFHDVASAAREGYCPKASCQSCPICFTALSLDVQDQLCFYNCGSCAWDSRSCQLTYNVKPDDETGSVSRVELARALEELGTVLKTKRETALQTAEQYSKELSTAWEQRTKQQQPKPAPKSKDGPEGWSVETLEVSLQDKKKQFAADVPSDGLSVQIEHVSLDDPPQLPSLGETILSDVPQVSLEMSGLTLGYESVPSPTHLLPLPMPYRVRESRRCRAELDEGRPGILLKPKLNPLEGDSSLRSGHGQWWKKDSSAIHVMPRIGVLKHEMHGNVRVFLLKVTNPTLGPVRLRFASSNYQGEKDAFGEGPGQFTKSKDGTTTDDDCLTTLPNLLVNELFQVYAPGVELNTQILQEMKRTDSVELQSAEDSFIELGGKSREIPDAVQNWKFDARESLSAMRLVASSASTAFFELSLVGATTTPEASSSSSTLQMAVPLALELEAGNGSWESSLIPKETKDDADDWVAFDLVITWT